MQSPNPLGNNLTTKLARMGQPFSQGLNLPTHLHTHTHKDQTPTPRARWGLFSPTPTNANDLLNQSRISISYITTLVRVSAPNLSILGTNGTDKMQQLKERGHHLHKEET